MIINVVDAHSSGAPCRIVVGGLEPLNIVGETMLAKKQYVEQNHDWLRTALLQEPRGHPALNADLVVPRCDPSADVGLVIINQRPVYPLMSGGNILCFVSAILEAGVLPIDRTSEITTVRVDTPGGIVVAHAKCSGDRVEHVTVENVPSFATHLNQQLDVPGLGALTVDVAYGGMFYVIVSAGDLGVSIDPENAARIVELGERVRAAAVSSVTVENPAATGFSSVDAVLVASAPRAAENHGRSAVVMPMLPGPPRFPAGVQGLIDRCPCGTGTSAQVAALVAKGELGLGDEFRQESIIDEVYSVRPAREVVVGGQKGIVPALTGSAHLIAKSEIFVSDDDPLRHGFTVGDIWPGARS
jgi:proline racemase